MPFTAYTFQDFSVNWHHCLLCQYLDAFAAGTIKRLMIFMPPRHGKTELSSRRLSAFMLGKNPDLGILCCSHTASLAADINRDVQRIIDSNAYRALFPATTLSGKNVRTIAGPAALRNSDVFELVGHDGFFRAAGVGTAIAGRGFDRGLIDDAHSGREAADSPSQREAVWKWYTGDFYTRKAPGARILITATRWHPEDLPGKLLKLAQDDPLADQWTVLRLPAICEESDKHPDDPREIGEALWPERYPLESLEKTKAANPYDFWSQYQQRPVAPGSTEWPDSYFNWPGFWFDEWPPLDLLTLRVMALDPSKGRESKSADYQALILHGRDKYGGEWVEADMGKRPMTASRAPDGSELSEGMVERCIERAAWFRPEGLALEVNQFQELLLVPLRDVLQRRKQALPIYPVENSVNKNVRIRRLGDPLGRRVVRFRNTPGTRILVEQLKQFPNAAHDDGPDGLEMARRLSIELHNER